MRVCSQCQAEIIEDQSQYCPFCGAETDKPLIHTYFRQIALNREKNRAIPPFTKNKGRQVKKKTQKTKKPIPPSSHWESFRVSDTKRVLDYFFLLLLSISVVLLLHYWLFC